GLVYCSGGLSGKYIVLAVYQIVHYASGLSFLIAVCLIRQRTDLASWNQSIDCIDVVKRMRSTNELDSIRTFQHEDKDTETNRGLRDSNYDQLYAYLKQYEGCCSECLPVDRIEGHGNNARGCSASGYKELRIELGMQIQVKQGRLSATTTKENGVALDEEQLLFIASGQDTAVDEDVDEQPVQDLALNVDNVFQADDCDAYDSDVMRLLLHRPCSWQIYHPHNPVKDEVWLRLSDSDILV
ncbi:hypothetical protein Tco_1540552, partial [Tanacetum coccineum]